MKINKFFFSALFCLTLMTSCSDDNDNPEVINPNEIITNVTLTFTNDADAMDTVVFSSVAPDGQDGTSTETIVGDFTSGATYSLSLAISDNSSTPIDDTLNDDIIPEADEHFFAFAVANIDLSVTRDADDIVGAFGSKLGVNTTWVAGAASTGNFQIRLIHEPTGTDDSDEFGTATGGSEDLNIVFSDIEIQ